MGTTTCLKMKQKFQAVKKMFQAQIKNQTQKFLSTHLGTTSNAKHVHAIHTRSQDGLHS